jgi:hypothetical protein
LVEKPGRKGKLGGDGVFADGFGGETWEKRKPWERGVYS